MFPRTGALQEKNENENRNEVDMGEKTPDEREHETLEDIDASTDRDSICKAPGVIEENNGEGGSEKLEKDSVEDNRHRKDDSKKEGGEDPKKIEGESEDNHSNKNDGERDEEEKDDGQRNDGEENENDGEEVDAGKGYDVKGDDCAEERKEGEQGDSGTDEDDGGADESDREEPETWSYRLAAALSNATPRSLAAMKSFWMSPNPLLVIRNDELKSDNGSSLDQASGGHPSIHLGFPLSNSQVEELCNEQLLVSDKNTGLDIIPNKFMVFGNKGFSGWVHQGAEELCKKLGIEGVHIELDFAVVLDGKQQVNGIGSCQESAGRQKRKILRFGKLMVALPAFDKHTIKVCNSQSTESDSNVHEVSSGTITAHHSPPKTTFAFWFAEAVPTISPPQSVTSPTLCLIYTVCISQKEVTQRGYEPWQLRMQDPNKAIANLKKCLDEWISRVQIGEEEPYLPWILSRYYKPDQKLQRDDAGRHDRIMQLAKQLELQLYLVRIDIQQDSKSSVAEWVDPNECESIDYRHPSPELEDPPRDENGKFYWEDDAEIEESYMLSEFYDLRKGCLVQSSTKLQCYLPSDTAFAQPMKFTTATPGLKQTYDKWEGALSNEWTLSALLFWPCKFHIETLVKLFGWNATFFLKENVHAGAQTGESITNRNALAPHILALPNPPKNIRSSDGAHPVGAVLLRFALEQRRTDLFLKALRRLGRPNASTDGELIHEALVVFAEKHDIIMELIEDYSNTTYWLQVLRRAQLDHAFIRTYLPRVTLAHKPSFIATDCSGRYQNLMSLWTSSTTRNILKFAFSVPQVDAAANTLCQLLATHFPDLGPLTVDFFATVLENIQSDIPKRNISPHNHPSIRHFFLGIWFKYILPSLGPRPKPPAARAPRNLSLPGHKCTSTATCSDCIQLSSFLVNKEIELWTIKMSIDRRRHVRDEVQSRYLYREFVQVEEEQPRGRVGTLMVKKVKLGYKDRIKAWESSRARTAAKLQQLSDEFFVSDEGNWWAMITAAVQPGGHGFTKEIAFAAKKFLAQDFPMEAQGPQEEAPPADIPTFSKNLEVVINTRHKRKQQDWVQETNESSISEDPQSEPPFKRVRSSAPKSAWNPLRAPVIHISDAE